MLFRQLIDQESHTLTYVVAGPRYAAIIDPVAHEVDTYVQLLRQMGRQLRFAIDTHVHADHVTALGELRERTGCVTVMGEPARAQCVSRVVQDGDVVHVDEGVELRAMHTPGHTDDSYCFVAGDRVFTGDTLLIGGTGRTDFQNGDPIAAYHSLFGRVLALPDSTIVYPGHDYRGHTSSTIGEERQHNPRLQVDSPEQYAAIMRNLNLPNPRFMDVAVPANLRCGERPS